MTNHTSACTPARTRERKLPVHIRQEINRRTHAAALAFEKAEQESLTREALERLEDPSHRRYAAELSNL